MAKKALEFNYEKKQRRNKMIQTGITILICLVLAYAMYTGIIPVGKLLAMVGLK